MSPAAPSTTSPHLASAHIAQTPCPLCQSPYAFTLARRDGKTGQPLHTVACSQCGLGRIDPLPSQEQLAQWYATAYRQDYKQAVEPRLRHVLRAARLMRERWDWLQHHHPLPGGSATLDVGASSGEFVYLMRHQGMAARGIEPHAGYAGFARERLGLDVLAGALQEHGHAAIGSFDLVTMFHVLEHLVDPVAELRRLAGLLRPGGLLLIEVPDTRRLCAPHTLYFRAHTLHFSPATLRGVAARAGLRVVADNFSEGGNLRVLLAPDAALQDTWMQHAAPALDDDLVVAQQRRRWWRYLVHRAADGYWLRKLATRVNERRVVRRHAEVKALLESVYAPTAGKRSRTLPAIWWGGGLSATFLDNLVVLV